MAVIKVERIGGLANFGGPGARIRSHGQIHPATLSEADRYAVEKLFEKREKKPSSARDMFSYRISRTTETGDETIEVPESALPASVIACVKDELI